MDLAPAENIIEELRKSLESHPSVGEENWTTDDASGLIKPASKPKLILPEPGIAMPTKETLQFSAYAQHQLEEIIKNYKLTPATLAFRLENKKVGPNQPLKWFPSPFLLYISLKIATGIAKGNARILISAPPRHGKSRISTIHTPLWILELFGNKNVVTTTYGADLSEDFARIIRDFIFDNPDDLDVRVRKDASRVAKFLTNKDGALTSIGLGGPITGRGADILLIDDYIKQIKEALSPTYRQYVWDWFTTTAMTRLEPNASVIVVATRWHKDDLIGRILKNFPDDWEHIKFHATAREDDPLGRKPGEALFPERYPVKVLNERRALLGSVYYDAIFDQEPHEGENDLTDKTWLIKKTPAEIPTRPFKLVRVWDFAGTETAKSDYTAGGLLAADIENKDVYLLDMERDQISAAKVEKLVVKTAEEDGPGVDICICQETGSAGKAVVEFYRNNLLKGYRVFGYYWNTNKTVVAQPWLAACESGHFYYLEAAWNKAFLDEFESFPSEGAGYHDDMMDVCSNGYIHLFGKRKVGTSWGRSLTKTGDNKPSDAQEQADLMKKAGLNGGKFGLKVKGSASFRSVRGCSWGRRSLPTQG